MENITETVVIEMKESKVGKVKAFMKRNWKKGLALGGAFVGGVIVHAIASGRTDGDADCSECCIDEATLYYLDDESEDVGTDVADED